MKSFFFTVLSFVSMVAAAAAQGFRIDSDLRWGNAAPIRSTTLFDGAVFYSFIGANGEIIRFEPAKDVFTLVDPALRIQTHLVASETQRIVNAKKVPLETHPNGFIAFAAKPVFTMEFDEAAGLMVLQSPWVDYSLTTKAFADTQATGPYFDFCDWSCFLNQRINPQPITLIRLEVNRILREKNRFPENIKISIFPKGKKFLTKEETIQASHEFSRNLTDMDRQRISQALESMRTFPVVSFAEYQSKVAEKIAAKKK